MRAEGVSREVFRVPVEFGGKRADVVFSHILPHLTRSQIKKLMEEGYILVEGKPVKPSKKLSGGEEVYVTILPPQPLEAIPQDLPIDIIFEDNDIVVVNKPAGMTVHPGAGTHDGTLVNAILYRCRDITGVGGRLRPGIVHRLDKDTSGVMVVAKNDISHQSLVAQFKSREVKKLYIALVLGELVSEAGSFSLPIGRDPVDRKKMSSKAKAKRDALTLWRVVKRYGGITLVEVEPKTGRTHQIRVHFAESGYPLLGDKVYGPKRYRSKEIEALSKRLGRQALHAFLLGFRHPRTGEYMEFKAHVPEDLKEVIDILEGKKTV